MQVQYDNTFTFTDIIIHTLKYDGLYIKVQTKDLYIFNTNFFFLCKCSMYLHSSVILHCSLLLSQCFFSHDSIKILFRVRFVNIVNSLPIIWQCQYFSLDHLDNHVGVFNQWDQPVSQPSWLAEKLCIYTLKENQSHFSLFFDSNPSPSNEVRASLLVLTRR